MARARPPLPEWGAKLARRLKKQGNSKGDIAKIIGYSVDTVKNVLCHYHCHGEDRKSCQGKGKLSDVRWIFAGPEASFQHAAPHRAKAFLVSVPCTHAIPILRSLVAFSPCPLSASALMPSPWPSPRLPRVQGRP